MGTVPKKVRHNVIHLVSLLCPRVPSIGRLQLQRQESTEHDDDLRHHTLHEDVWQGDEGPDLPPYTLNVLQLNKTVQMACPSAVCVMSSLLLLLAGVLAGVFGAVFALAASALALERATCMAQCVRIGLCLPR